MEKIIDKYIKEYLGIDSISTNTDKFIYVNKDASEKKFKDALANFYNITKIIYFKGKRQIK